MSAPCAAAELAALAAWIDERLGDETADRQLIAEEAIRRVRGITLSLLGAAELASTVATGPFGTEAEARDVPAVRAIWDTWRATQPAPAGSLGAPSARLIELACERAGVVTGTYDRRLIAWLARFGPEYCAVFAGLISRANLGHLGAGQAGPAPAAVPGALALTSPAGGHHDNELSARVCDLDEWGRTWVLYWLAAAADDSPDSAALRAALSALRAAEGRAAGGAE